MTWATFLTGLAGGLVVAVVCTPITLWIVINYLDEEFNLMSSEVFRVQKSQQPAHCVMHPVRRLRLIGTSHPVHYQRYFD